MKGFFSYLAILATTLAFAFAGSSSWTVPLAGTLVLVACSENWRHLPALGVRLLAGMVCNAACAQGAAVALGLTTRAVFFTH